MYQCFTVLCFYWISDLNAALVTALDTYLNLFLKILLNLRLLNRSVYKAAFIYFRKVSGNDVLPKSFIPKAPWYKTTNPCSICHNYGLSVQFFLKRLRNQPNDT